MKVLLLGGTKFIGRHIAGHLLAAGHTVTILTRGVSPDELSAEVERLRGDRDGGVSGLASLGHRQWDACVDLSGYTPLQVRPSAEALAERVGRYVYVSAVSVYGDPTLRPVLETHTRMPPGDPNETDVNGETYGPLKVACEDLVQQIFGAGCTLLRPQAVEGRFEQTGRCSYWVHRALQPGPMLAPGDGTDHLQLIDVRDVARFVVTVIENDIAGVFNLAGPRFTWSEFMWMLGAHDLVWIDAKRIDSAGLGFRELPLFRPEHGHRAGLMDVSNERARHAGLTLTAPEATMSDIHDWVRSHPPVHGLTAARETELIDMVRRTPMAD